jgi:hypothetical protein
MEYNKVTIPFSTLFGDAFRYGENNLKMKK